MSSNNKNSRKRGVDVLLTARGKNLAPQETVTFRLVKGPSVQTTADPVDPKAVPEPFPLVAKFPESVVKPEFTLDPWNQGRLYQQDIPKPTDDSDEEVTEAPKRRWKYRRHDTVKRQWILQEQVDFLETMVARREKKVVDGNKISSRYEGVPEHNASRYCLFMPTTATNGNANANANAASTTDTLQVCLLPSENSVVNFAQPASRQTLTLNQAEQAIEDKIAGIRVVRPTSAENGQPVMLRIPRTKPAGAMSRLLNKLTAKSKQSAAGGDEEEGDDVMADLAFRKGKSGKSSARKELLTDLGDGVKVSDDGVLGGTNDAAYGGRQRFGQFQSDKGTDKSNKEGEEDGATRTERGGDGAAMQDDFYQRDVQAEYEELDYDANEQFDDDDVDLGETDVVIDSGGYGDDDEGDEFEEFDLDDEVVAGAAGLASVAGFKLMLAKARGEVQVQPTAEEAAAAAAENEKDGDSKRAGSPSGTSKKEKDGDHMAKIMAAAEKSAQAAKEKATQQKAQKAATAASQVQVDENGLRIITLEAVRREIWLHHGSIPIKRLMKIFEVKTKWGPERQNKFREVVKELCIMKTDPIDGRMLVLKQHYSNM